MKKKFKFLISSLVTLSLSVATVMCCCSAAAAAAHFHKPVMVCSHCHGHESKGNPSNPTASCQQQLTSAEFSGAQTFSLSSEKGVFFTPAFLDKHAIFLVPSLILSYPRGSPPLTANFTPLYLRTFHLRI